MKEHDPLETTFSPNHKQHTINLTTQPIISCSTSPKPIETYIVQHDSNSSQRCFDQLIAKFHQLLSPRDEPEFVNEPESSSLSYLSKHNIPRVMDAMMNCLEMLFFMFCGLLGLRWIIRTLRDNHESECRAHNLVCVSYVYDIFLLIFFLCFGWWLCKSAQLMWLYVRSRYQNKTKCCLVVDC